MPQTQPEILELDAQPLEALRQRLDTETLRSAQAAPDEYRDLLVRVAGYSDYFIDLDEYHQEEIIARTEQETF